VLIVTVRHPHSSPVWVADRAGASGACSVAPAMGAIVGIVRFAIQRLCARCFGASKAVMACAAQALVRRLEITGAVPGKLASWVFRPPSSMAVWPVMAAGVHLAGFLEA
jgi:hypothetical protein